MHARERLYLTADKDRLVGEGDTKAAFLYATKGDEIPDSAAAKFGLVDGLLKAKGRTAQTPLHGSSTLASTFDIGGKTVQLGTLVIEAHKRSGLDADQWNTLPDAERDALISVVLDELQKKAAAAPPPAKKAPAKKAAAKADATPPPAKKAAAKEQKPAAEDKEAKAPENKGS